MRFIIRKQNPETLLPTLFEARGPGVEGEDGTPAAGVR